MGLFGISGVSLADRAGDICIKEVCLHSIIDDTVYSGHVVNINLVAKLLDEHLLFTLVWDEGQARWHRGVFIDGIHINGIFQLKGRDLDSRRADIRTLPTIQQVKAIAGNINALG